MIEMLTNLFRHAVYRQSQVGQLLLLEVQASQLEAGTPNWVLSMHQFMYNHNITTHQLKLTAASACDKFILLSQLGNFGYISKGTTTGYR